jgi:hypothetical protein
MWRQVPDERWEPEPDDSAELDWASARSRLALDSSCRELVCD